VKKFCKTLCRNYKDKDLNQQFHFLKYLKIFKNKIRTFLKKISQYCRQYTLISEKLIKIKKLQRTLRNACFLQNLSKKFNEKLAIRCSLNENDEDKMRFENLMKQILQLIKSRSVIIKTRKTNYKMKKTTTLMKEMKSIMKKNVNEYLINLLKTMKSQSEESISNVDIRLDDLIEIMRKMTMNVDNLINCVFLSSERDNSESSQDYQSYMFSRYSFSNQLFMLNSRSFSLFLQICFFRICHLRLCHFWIMKLRVRLLLNVFTATKRIICTKEKFISIFIILMSFTFEWFFTKINDNVSRMRRS
jgi:hypothetical protein